VHAALAAHKGYVAEEGILETRQGFFEVYGGTDGAGVTRDLGRDWDIVTDMAIKLVPGGHPSHALAEAAANAARAAHLSPADVESITVSRPGLTALSGPVHPTDLIGMAHSPAYFLAAGGADHDVSWVHATEAKITEPVSHQLIAQGRVGEPPTGHVERYKQGATVTIRTTAGRSFSSTVSAPTGAGVRGIDRADVDAKYRTRVPQAQWRARQVEASLPVIHDFRHVTHVSALIALLHARS
jgi:2-methylcitrate dehydratase PrpD